MSGPHRNGLSNTVKSRIQMFQQQESCESSFVVNSGNKYTLNQVNINRSSHCESNSNNTVSSTMNSKPVSPTSNPSKPLQQPKISTSTMTISLSSSSEVQSQSATSLSSSTTPNKNQHPSGESNNNISTPARALHQNGASAIPVNGHGNPTPPFKLNLNNTPKPPLPPGQKPFLQRTTSIPKLVSPVLANNPIANANGHNMMSQQFRGANVSTGAGIAGITRAKNGSANIPPAHRTGQQLYDSISWKDKYEDSEKRRIHVVTLAQKATRDYEELRRRFNDANSEKEKLAYKLSQSNSQLESLRKASEATYELYYKLKKKYEVENSSKSEALVRVDQYNKENRRLKRQSQVLMQQINGSNIQLEDLIELSENENTDDNDKEIDFLRKRVQELETKLIDVESELETTKLAEFESQESVMLINDNTESIKSENVQLKKKITGLEIENSDLKSSLEQVKFDLDELCEKEHLERQKLHLVEAELRKIQTEKSILQRQSHVLLSANPLDSQLLETLNTLSELQFTLEEQRYNYEAQLEELENQIRDKSLEFESQTLQSEAKIKTLEGQIVSFQKKLDEAESARECSMVMKSPACPPPPPPPMPCGPPPPPPSMSGLNLNSSVQSVTLRRVKNTGESGSPPNEKSLGLDTSPQIDELVSQIKKGIKLKPMDRTLTRKPTELSESGSNKANGDDSAVEEMKSILNNLKRTRRVIP